MAGTSNGFAACFVRIFFDKEELTDRVEKFGYTYEEEDDEVCCIDFKLDNPEDVDKPCFQDKAQLSILWGFIGGDVSKERKVYVQDVKATFKDTIYLTLTCTEKAVSLKFSDANTVFKDSSMLDVANLYAKKHDLKAFVQVPDADPNDFYLEPIPGEEFNSYLMRKHDESLKRQGIKVTDRDLGADVKKAMSMVPINDELITKKNNYYRSLKPMGKSKWLDLYRNSGEAEIDRKAIADSFKNDPHFSIVKFFGDYKNLPQANKSDKALLTEMGKRERNGPWIAETRDDMLILKRRNFNQAPYKLYEYGGTTGDLLEFTPMTKNYSHKGHHNSKFSGWDPINKNFHTGETNASIAETNPMLAKFLDMVQRYKTIEKGGGGLLIAGIDQQKQSQIFIDERSSQPVIDDIGDYKRHAPGIPITVTDRIKVLEKIIGNVNDTIRNYNKSIYDPLSSNPMDAFQNAENRRIAQQLKTNPAKARFFGDPSLIVGIIITIVHASSKFSGNYYIIKAEHSMTSKEGYITEVEMVRQGQNIMVNKHFKSYKALNKRYNNQVGPDHAKSQGKDLPLKKNP